MARATFRESLVDLGMTIIPEERVTKMKSAFVAKKVRHEVLGWLMFWSSIAGTFLFAGGILHKLDVGAPFAVLAFVVGTVLSLIGVIGAVATPKLVRQEEWFSHHVLPVDLHCWRAPGGAVRDACLISSAVPEVYFTVETFAEDPFLYVHRKKRRYCIAHWE